VGPLLAAREAVAHDAVFVQARRRGLGQTYNTTGALAAVQLQGTVVASMTLTLVASSVPAGCTAPATYTISSDEPVFAAGEGAVAALTFSPTTQDQNCVTLGVSSANINGAVGIGSAQ